MLGNILLLGIGLWAVWTGLKTCEQVHGIALVITGLILVIWGLTLAPLWLQVLVEIFLIGIIQFFARMYAREFFLYRRINIRRSRISRNAAG
ncbi:MAG TPA: hypothetical protein V6D50_12950 [Chroococcales cyanobacterium]|jgi:hypothetical protein